MKKGILSAALATFFFSTMEIALKFSSGSFNAVQLTFLRFLIGGLVLLPPAAREIRRRTIPLRTAAGIALVLVGSLVSSLPAVLAKKERKQGETLGAETGVGGVPDGAER